MAGAHLPQQCFGLLMRAPGGVQAGLSVVQPIQALIQGGFYRVPAGRLRGRRGLERSGRGVF